MQYWSLYFFAKFGLFLADSIRFSWPLNLLLAIFVSLRFKERKWRIAKHLIAIPLALALLYRESNLPPIGRALAAAKDVAGFSPAYLMELIGRFVHLSDILIVVAMLIMYRLLSSRVRFTSFAFAAILLVPLISHFQKQDDDKAQYLAVKANEAVANRQDPASLLDAFYTEERARAPIKLPSASGQTLPFDVVLLHICSLSWDDLAFVGEADPSVLKRFDVIFRNFNSAASYSGPAALRLLRGTCGQSPHASLYAADPDECSLFKNFTAAGYDVQAVLNHDGVFGRFADDIQAYSGLPVTVAEGKWGEIAMRSFDGRPIYGDLSVLSKWWEQHRGPTSVAASAKPTALYYNTITLHDGNIIAGVQGSSMQTYKRRLDKMLADFDRFIAQLEAAGRPVVVIMVPEHGAALRGDKMQIAGMREIPNPKVTLVPAAVKVIGMKKNTESAPPIFVDRPTSYTAVFTLLANIMNREAASLDTLQLSDIARGLPTTRFVSENEKIVVMQGENDFFMRSPEGTWIKYAN
ncbi:cellulose biosynthesis protein BcsG [uncultured Oxalicibacterium sp.]|uniref:cellulose biosynthesis protein BcsG n=1 Tax=uncultured Oxalicibacterium sp. TaxID=1168540 RepID=UPI0025D3AA44|nr:cellulose biosynthesis protein BcsG [uncultured Oxalicibacterium sp.]